MKCAVVKNEAAHYEIILQVELSTSLLSQRNFGEVLDRFL